MIAANRGCWHVSAGATYNHERHHAPRFTITAINGQPQAAADQLLQSRHLSSKHGLSRSLRSASTNSQQRQQHAQPQHIQDAKGTDVLITTQSTRSVAQAASAAASAAAGPASAAASAGGVSSRSPQCEDTCVRQVRGQGADAAVICTHAHGTLKCAGVVHCCMLGVPHAVICGT